jgi:hypothetical protein
VYILHHEMLQVQLNLERVTKPLPHEGAARLLM